MSSEQMPKETSPEHSATALSEEMNTDWRRFILEGLAVATSASAALLWAGITAYEFAHGNYDNIVLNSILLGSFGTLTATSVSKAAGHILEDWKKFTQQQQ